MGMAGGSCPVSGVQVDLNTARTNALVVAAALALAVASGGSLGWLAILLAADFAIKVVAGSAYSPVCLLASGVNRLVGVRSRPGDWAPKRFAAGLGLAFSLAASTGWLLGLDAVFYGCLRRPGCLCVPGGGPRLLPWLLDVRVPPTAEGLATCLAVFRARVPGKGCTRLDHWLAARTHPPARYPGQQADARCGTHKSPYRHGRPGHQALAAWPVPVLYSALGSRMRG